MAQLIVLSELLVFGFSEAMIGEQFVGISTTSTSNEIRDRTDFFLHVIEPWNHGDPNGDASRRKRTTKPPKVP